jgi:hypothetical protein
MRCKPIVVLLPLTASLAVGSVAWALEYKVTVLHPLVGFEESLVFDAIGDVQVGYGMPEVGFTDVTRALMWRGTRESVVDLHPAGFRRSVATAATAIAQFGNGISSATGSFGHALMWHGTAESVVDLHPAGFANSSIEGADASHQVGIGFPNRSDTGGRHALMWNGTATNVVDLHPPGFTESEASDVFGSTQVGSARPATGGGFHAVMWHGSAESFVDLHPAGYRNSYAIRVSATKQLSEGSLGGLPHALLWSGSAESVVNLSPEGMSSYAWDMAEDMQVGSAAPRGMILSSHAYIWRGTAASGVDLHPYVVAALGPEFTFSNALAVTESGDVYGVASAFPSAYAVKWSPIPEPTGAALIGPVLLLAAFSPTKRQGEEKRGRTVRAFRCELAIYLQRASFTFPGFQR